MSQEGGEPRKLPTFDIVVIEDQQFKTADGIFINATMRMKVGDGDWDIIGIMPGLDIEQFACLQIVCELARRAH
jgi:hypothetical protein